MNKLKDKERMYEVQIEELKMSLDHVLNQTDELKNSNEIILTKNLELENKLKTIEKEKKIIEEVSFI